MATPRIKEPNFLHSRCLGDLLSCPPREQMKYVTNVSSRAGSSGVLESGCVWFVSARLLPTDDHCPPLSPSRSLSTAERRCISARPWRAACSRRCSRAAPTTRPRGSGWRPSCGSRCPGSGWVRERPPLRLPAAARRIIASAAAASTAALAACPQAPCALPTCSAEHARAHLASHQHGSAQHGQTQLFVSASGGCCECRVHGGRCLLAFRPRDTTDAPV